MDTFDIEAKVKDKKCGNCVFFRRADSNAHGPGRCPFSRDPRLFPSHRACRNYERGKTLEIRVCEVCGRDISSRQNNALYCVECANNIRRGRSRAAKKEKVNREACSGPALLPGLTGGQIEALARKYGMHYGTFTAAIRMGDIKIESLQRDINQMIEKKKC